MSMKTSKGDYLQVKVGIDTAEREKARVLARSTGMTFQGFVGQLIKRELAKSQHEQLSAEGESHE